MTRKLTLSGELNSPLSTLHSQLRIALCIIALLAASSFATQARIESMGKRPAFFLDDITMFTNPANATFYSSALMGELGFYSQNSLGTSDIGNLGTNVKDPFSPWFGALFRYGLHDEGLRDPQITIGGFFGYDHWEFTRFVPREVIVGGETYRIPNSVTNFDGFLAGTMLDGSAVGTHIYVAVQDGKQDVNAAGTTEGELTKNAHVSILAMDYGANFLVTNTSSVELSFGIARIQYGPSRKGFLDPGLFSFYSNGRLFLETELLNGQYIVGYKIADMKVPSWEEMTYNLNTGVNVMIPRGLFWLGIDAVRIKETVGSWEKREDRDENDRVVNSWRIYREPGSREVITEDRSDAIGGIISFGIERNVFRDWIIIRTGGQKSLFYKKCVKNSAPDVKSAICPAPLGRIGGGNYWETNPGGDGSLGDHLGLGLGFNMDNKLKIDVTIAEDAFFRNPFTPNGSIGRFISRVSALYRF